jgi:hypothetical protein
MNGDNNDNCAKRKKVKDDSDEIDEIELKIQGIVLFRVERKVLMQGPDDSYFQAACRPYWRDGISISSGTKMINLKEHIFDIDLTEIIVRFLSKKCYEGPEYPVKAFNNKIDENKKKQFNDIVTFLGLKSFLYPFNFMDKDTIAELVGEYSNYEVVYCTDNKYISSSSSSSSKNVIEYFSTKQFIDSSKFIACKTALDYSMDEGFFWKVTIGDMESCFIGIIGHQVLDDPTFSYAHKTSYGWNNMFISHTDIDSHVIKAGMRQNKSTEEDDWNEFTRGECLYFQLKSNKLSMFTVRTKQTFVIDDINMAKDAKYYIHLNISRSYPSSDDATLFTLDALCEEEIAQLLDNGKF